MKRRFLSAMISVVMAASLVTGCAGSSSGTADTKAEEVKAGDTKDNGGTGTGNKDTQAASGEQVTLTVMDGYAPEDPHGQYIYQYAEEFMKENPDIKVEIQAIASGDIYTKLAAMATSPDDLPTMFFTSADQVPTLYDPVSYTHLDVYKRQGAAGSRGQYHSRGSGRRLQIQPAGNTGCGRGYMGNPDCLYL